MTSGRSKCSVHQLSITRISVTIIVPPMHKNITSPRTLLIATLIMATVVLGTVTGCTSTPSDTATATANQSVAITPRLQGADNFRDIGGIGVGYPTTDGKHVRRGVVYRSNALTLTPADVSTLESLHISSIIDLRTPSEIAQKPDAAVSGASWVNENVLGVPATAKPDLTSADASVQYMESVYQTMVTSEASRKAIAETLTDISKNSHATIVHCTAGKDRTGWVSALLLHIAGVSQQNILNNYLLTNQYSAQSISTTLAGIKAQSGAAAAAAYAPLLGVQASFLDASYASVKQNYGSIDNYLTKGLGLSSSTISTLKSKLTV